MYLLIQIEKKAKGNIIVKPLYHTFQNLYSFEDISNSLWYYKLSIKIVLTM